MLKTCLFPSDDKGDVQDCLQALATKGQSVAGFIEDVIFQSFRVDPKSMDAKERWVRFHRHLPEFEAMLLRSVIALSGANLWLEQNDIIWLRGLKGDCVCHCVPLGPETLALLRSIVLGCNDNLADAQQVGEDKALLQAHESYWHDAQTRKRTQASQIDQKVNIAQSVGDNVWTALDIQSCSTGHS